MSKNKEELIIRLLTEKRIYDDSPSTTVTYKDLSRIIESIIEITDNRNIEGFKK